MQAIAALPVLGPVRSRSSNRVRPTRSPHSEDRSTSTQDGDAPRGVVYSFTAHAAAARPPRPEHDPTDSGLDPDGRGPSAFVAQGPGGDRRALSPAAVDLPERLGEFSTGSALEAQLLTPSLHAVHSALLRRA